MAQLGRGQPRNVTQSRNAQSSVVSLVVADSAQTQASGNVVLVPVGVLVVDGTAQTQASDNVALTQHQVLTVANSAQTQASENAVLFIAGALLYPVAASGRKLVDQNGDVIQLRTLSSWGLAQVPSNTDITARLEEVAARGFNAVTVVLDGAFSAAGGTGWDQWHNTDSGLAFYTGTPYQSTLGPAWDSHVAHLMDETARLGMFVLASCYPGGSFGGGGAYTAMTDAGATNCRTTGQRWATFLSDWDHWILHIGVDGGDGLGSAIMTAVDGFCRGIKDVASGMLVVAEQAQGADTLAQWPPGSFTYFTPIEGLYNYSASSVEVWDATYTGDPSTGPVWDTEAAYIAYGHYSGTASIERQNLRERHYVVPIRGGVGVNNGHENWWSFDAEPSSGSPDTSATAMDNVTVVQWQYGWDIWDICNVSDWAPVSTLLVAGLGSGDTKAAQGASSTWAVAYFPSSRTVTVDTTIMAGSGAVRLRWFDPTDGTYTSIASSEAQNASRTVTYPSAHADGSNDWALVIDLQVWELVVANTAQTQASDAAGALTQHQVLTVANSAQTQASENVALTQHQVLTVANSAQTQASDAAGTLTQHQVLTVANSAQTQASDNVTIVPAGSLGGNSSAQTQASENVALVQHQVLVVQSSAQAQASESVTVTANNGVSITVANTAQAQTSTAPTLTQHQVLVVQASAQTQASGNVSINVNGDDILLDGPITYTVTGPTATVTVTGPQATVEVTP